MGKVSDRIAALNSQSRANSSVVFSGHGGWSKGDGEFTVPANTTITFYQDDNVSLGNNAGQLVDSLTRFNSGARGHEKFTGGQKCKNYRLYPREQLALMGHSKFEQRFVTSTDDAGVQLKDLLAQHIGKDCHWAACRNHM
ncbi:MAG: hypothetical protein JNL50_12175 [Phycisphaerae bacterium]|nr:hypothetical protein [Phycisphaerae bacterium]